MKNLKKVLSLALAFAMALGLCIGASAAQDVTTLTDWNEVENKDAATLLNAFNIMQGDDKGFRPHDNVKRTEAAKMISVALWGGKDDKDLYASGNIGSYTDTPVGAWYMGYVNYMTVQGIVTGKGEGNFDPEGTVTGYELLKMCLVALGYDAETEGLVGAGWDLKTMALATKRGTTSLTKGADVTNWNAPLSRMNAATIIANMINRNTVGYNEGKVVVGTKTFGVEVLGMTETKGTLVANPYGTIVTIGDSTDDEDNAKKIDPTARGYAGQNAIVRTLKDNEDKTAKVFDKNWKLELDSTAADLGATVSMYIVGNQVVSATVNAPAEVEPSFNKDSGLMTNSQNPDTADTLGITWILNGAVESAPQTNIYAAGKVYTVEKGKMTVEGDAEVKFYDTNGDGYIDLVNATKFDSTTATLKNVTKVDEDKDGNKYFEYLADGATGSATKVMFANVDVEPEKGDAIFIVDVANNCFGAKSATNAKSHAVVLNTVEGAITRYATNTIWIDGVKYTSTQNYGADAAAAGVGTFFLNLKGEVVKFSAAAGDAGEATYAVVFNAGVAAAPKQGALTTTNVYTLRVSAILEDGTVADYDVASVSTDGTSENTTKTFEQADDLDDAPLVDAANNGATDGKNYLVTYNINNDKQLVVTSIIGEIGASGDTAVAASGFTGTVKVGSKYLTANTIGFLQTAAPTATATDKWAVTKGTALATAINKDASGNVTAVFNQLFDATNKNDGIAVMAAEASEVKTSSAATADLYYALSGESASTANGVTTYYVTVYNSKTNKVEELSYKATNSGVDAGKLYTSFDEGTTGLGGEIATALVTKGYVQATTEGIVNIAIKSDDTGNGSKAILTNDKTKCFLIDTEDTTNCKSITLADVVEQTVPTEITTDFQVIVVEGNSDTSGNSANASANGTATMIIVIAE